MKKLTSRRAKAFLIAAIVIIALIAGFLLYRNYALQNEERSSLVAEIQKNHLTEENADYLQKEHFLDINKWISLKDIANKATDDKIDLAGIKKLRKDQLDILNPINKKLSKKDTDLTNAINDNLRKLDSLGIKIKDSMINLDEVRSVTGQIVSLQRTVNENLPLIYKKIEQLSNLKKVAFDKKAFLKGDFSSIAGTYINVGGSEVYLNKQGSNSNDKSCKGSKPKLNKDTGVYTWTINCKKGSLLAYFFPIGVPAKVKVNGKMTTIPSNTDKNRVAFGNKVNNTGNIYQRK